MNWFMGFRSNITLNFNEHCFLVVSQDSKTWLN